MYAHFKKAAVVLAAVLAVAACSPGGDSIELTGGAPAKQIATEECRDVAQRAEVTATDGTVEQKVVGTVECGSASTPASSVPTVHASDTGTPVPPSVGGVTVDSNGVTMPGMTVGQNGVTMPGLTVGPNKVVVGGNSVTQPPVIGVPQAPGTHRAVLMAKMKEGLDTVVTSYCSAPVDLMPATMRASFFQQMEKQYQTLAGQLAGTAVPSFRDAVTKQCSSYLPR